MTAGQGIAVGEVRAARLMDMTLPEFRALVAAGHLLKGREIAPGVVRWDVAQLQHVTSGSAALDGCMVW